MTALPPTDHQQPLLVIVTGQSGAGKSTVINALEDLDFYCIDNLPLELAEHTVSHFMTRTHQHTRFALGMNVRSRGFAEKFKGLKENLSGHMRTEVVFLSCEEELLTDRYNTTRRKHPMIDEGGELVAAIRRERSLLGPVELAADTKFDTTTWSPHFLARQVEKRFSSPGGGRNLYLSIISFGFKNGMLKPADSVFDVRFLRNPYFDTQLKSKTGLDPAVAAYIGEDPHTGSFLDRLVSLHEYLLPLYYAEGKHYFRVGVGCTGGKHRSVMIAENLAGRISDRNIDGVMVSVTHRDLEFSARSIF